MWHRRFVSMSVAILLVMSFNLVLPQVASAATYTVTNTNDSGLGSLRQAIDNANSNPGPDTITFDPGVFPAGFPATIVLQTPLSLTDTSGGTTIEGDGRVILTSSIPPSDVDRRTCLVVKSNNNVIRGLQIIGFWVGIDFDSSAVTQNNIVGGNTMSQRNIISNNLHAGIRLYGAGNASNLVIGNYIGINPSGTAAWGVQHRGIAIDNGAHNNIIGGTSPQERNIVSGNTWVGIVISDTNKLGTSNNHIRGNYVGTDYTGTVAIPNNQGGVAIGLDATGNVIGGTMPGAGNVISGHNATTPHGIRISQTQGNYIYGNIIGLTADGSTSLPNGISIRLEGGANNNFIGGPGANMRNIISGNSSSGIWLSQSHGNTIQGNYIGTDISGTKAVGAWYAGVVVDNSANNTIGGTTPGARNLISGNEYRGVHIYGVGSTNNTVVGNYIGTDVSGTASVKDDANVVVQDDGIRIDSQATNNIIGGTTTGARNIISGNRYFGICIDGLGTNNNLILGNYIGTDFSGTVALGNGGMGIILNDSPSGTIIGGTMPGAGNLISGNGGIGIQVGYHSSHTLVQGNLIGTDKTGTAAIPNASTGAACGIMIGAANNNTIGGNVPGARNLISGNTRSANGIGISIQSNAADNLIIDNFIGTDITGTAALGNDYGIHIYASQNNTIRENVIHHNTVRGVNIIDTTSIRNRITQNSITGNDANNPGSGIMISNNANQGILPPVITSVTSNTVTGTTSAPNGSIVEIFQDAGNQGNIYIGSATVSGGSFSFIGSVPPAALGGNLTATVTDPNGDTSEFSLPVTNNLGIVSTIAWTRMNSGTTNDLHAVWGSAPNNVFAVGQHGIILRYNGTSWSPMASGTTMELNAVWGSSATNVFAVGGTYVYGSGHSGIILRYNGTSWSTIYTDPNYQYYGVWGSGPNDVFAVGSGGRIIHYNGSSWSPMPSGTAGAAVMAIWGTGGNDVFAVGFVGNIVHYNGISWSKMPSNTTRELRSIWGTAANNVFVVGDEVILRYNGASWSVIPGGLFTGVWGSSASNVFAVGYSGTIHRYDGNTWSPIPSGTAYALLDVWGSAWNDIFVVGAGGTILHAGGIIVSAYSPVDITVTDPDGQLISKTLNQIPGATYEEVDLNGDGDLDDRVNIPIQKIGTYVIKVIPEPGASPTDTYTLEVSIAGQTVVLAQDVPVGEVPAPGYPVISVPSQVKLATVDLDPDTLNLKSKGTVVTAYIELPTGYDVRQIDISSVRLNGTVPALAKPTAVGDHDGDGIPDLMVKFDRAAVQSILTTGNQVKITITVRVGAAEFEGSDIIRVLSE